MIHKNILLLIFLLVFVNLSLYLIPTFAPSMKKEFIMPYQLWFNGLAVLLALNEVGKKQRGGSVVSGLASKLMPMSKTNLLVLVSLLFGVSFFRSTNFNIFLLIIFLK